MLGSIVRGQGRCGRHIDEPDGDPDQQGKDKADDKAPDLSGLLA